MAKELRLGCEPVVGELKKSKGKEYRVTNKIKEGKDPIYGIAFNFIDSRFFDVFATVNTNQINVYQCHEGGNISVLQNYVDENEKESFYSVSWACKMSNKSPLLVAGGVNGIIRVIDVGREIVHKSLFSHGGPINEIRTQPQNPCLVVSASKDETIRVWNVETGVCIFLFAGDYGHRNEVICADFNPRNKYLIVSGGMDKTLKIWSFEDFWTNVEKSFEWDDEPGKFPTKHIQCPIFLASDVHYNYVDCAMWVGKFILSKSVENEIVLWKRKSKKDSLEEGETDILQKYPLPDSDIWFIKFSTDFHCKLVAAGNRVGDIFVWDFQSSPPVLIDKLSHNECKDTIRETAVSYDGNTILGCCDNGAIWRWDVKKVFDFDLNLVG